MRPSSIKENSTQSRILPLTTKVARENNRSLVLSIFVHLRLLAYLCNVNDRSFDEKLTKIPLRKNRAHELSYVVKRLAVSLFFAGKKAFTAAPCSYWLQTYSKNTS